MLFDFAFDTVCGKTIYGIDFIQSLGLRRDI